MAKQEPVDGRNLAGSGAPPIPWARARERLEEDAGISPTRLSGNRPSGWQAACDAGVGSLGGGRILL